jgi:hypothetical protein
MVLLALILAAGFAWFPRGKGSIADAEREAQALASRGDRPRKPSFVAALWLQRDPSLRSLRTVSAGPEFESPAVYQNFFKNFGRDASDFATTLPELYVTMCSNR